MPKLPDFPPRASLPDNPMLLGAGNLGRFGAGAGAAAAAAAASGPLLDPLAIHRKLLSQKIPGVTSPAVSNSASSLLSAASSAAGSGTSPGALGGSAHSASLYEMAALTHELDTQAVTTKVKEILLANNVGQKVRFHSY